MIPIMPTTCPAGCRSAPDVGVTKFIGGDRTLALTEAAHAVGIKVDPYVNYNSFPRHGSARVQVRLVSRLSAPPCDRGPRRVRLWTSTGRSMMPRK